MIFSDSRDDTEIKMNFTCRGGRREDTCDHGMTLSRRSMRVKCLLRVELENKSDYLRK